MGCNGSDKYRDVPAILSIIKTFEEYYSEKVMMRCCEPAHMEQNSETDCLRWAVPRLLRRPEGKKILFILGDGDPSNGSISNKLAYSYREYLTLCKSLGIIVFGFGIGCDLEGYFGEDCLGCDVSDIGDKMLTKLTEILNRKKVVHV